ncbi:hypothetical protein SPFM20_00294 [Salmonella phage SPFM20]|nr:hypothetical protein SPFM8_00292 [Salmonella phage SPFM8]VFR14972.1 hypothetical protein SPFM20_00294 [Salmonella phage SPFM20]
MNYKHYQLMPSLFDSMCAAVMQKRLPTINTSECLSRSESSAINEMPWLDSLDAVDVVAIYTGSDTPSRMLASEVFPVLMQLPQFQPLFKALEENKLPTTLRPQCSYLRIL